nr:trifunctional transcriptional activator/DNA repair protein Ada/methylated-DNA--[protein]-cysteine S-methyltransferase [uncultured Pseudomonas sp.]
MRSYNHALPPRSEMVNAMLCSDTAYEGVFFTAVKTTGIFCRPTCGARKPKPENVEFFSQANEAMAAGYRPCLRCKPLDLAASAPDWVKGLLASVSASPDARWSDAELTTRGIDPLRLRRWFKQNFGMTFHAWMRSRRLGVALGRISSGETLDNTAFDLGYESLSGFRDAFKKTFQMPPGKAAETSLLLYRHLTTPLGPMIAMAEERGLVLLEFLDRPALTAELNELRGRHGYSIAPGEHIYIKQLEVQLKLYFDGKLKRFSVPLHMPGSSFDRLVWAELLKIDYGTLSTYGAIAGAIGKPGASQAVGNANGHNRLSIIVPCHRVIATNGALAGYGGGQPRKEFLLRLEKTALQITQQDEFLLD